MGGPNWMQSGCAKHWCGGREKKGMDQLLEKCPRSAIIEIESDEDMKKMARRLEAFYL